MIKQYAPVHSIQGHKKAQNQFIQDKNTQMKTDDLTPSYDIQ